MKPLDRTHLILLSAAIGMLLLSFGFVWLHLTSPSDGARLGPDEPFGEGAWQSNGILVTPLDEAFGGLHQGDLVIAVDGISIETWAQALTTPDFPRPQWRFNQQVTYRVIREGVQIDVPVRLQSYPLKQVLASAGTLPFMALTLLASAGYLYCRRPQERATLPLLVWSICALSTSISIVTGLQMSDVVGGVGFWLFKVASFGAATLGLICFLNFALVFPQPHPILARLGGNAWSISAMPMVGYGVYLVLTRIQAASMLSWVGLWTSSLPGAVLIYLGLTSALLVSGYLYTRKDTIARQQSRLVVFATLTMSVLAIAFAGLPKVLLGHTLVDRNILALLPLILMGSITGAILRYRLFDLDVIINRALVYSALTALVVALYGLLTGLLSAVLQSSGNVLVSLVTTGGAAILFQPLREYLQRSVNRLMYGERDDPYAVLSRLGQRLEATIAAAAVLPTIAETVGQALKLSYAAIALKEDADFRIVATYGMPKGELLRLPLIYQGETIGQLILGPRAPGEAFTSVDRRLLEDLAHQAGIAAHAIRLTADLQRSREHLVTAREEERRRLRRDLHDGLGPALASMSFRLDAICNLLENDPDAARNLVTALKSQIQASLDDIRRIAYDLRPPALDELGLVGALTEHIIAYKQSNRLQIALEAPNDLLQLAAAVEVAAYRIALEAITNVTRHAHAHHCRISLSVDDSLCLAIVDDGQGLPEDFRAGIGITSMRERAEELGGTCVVAAIPTGGTQVVVRLPLPADDRTW